MKKTSLFLFIFLTNVSINIFSGDFWTPKGIPLTPAQKISMIQPITIFGNQQLRDQINIYNRAVATNNVVQGTDALLNISRAGFNFADSNPLRQFLVRKNIITKGETDLKGLFAALQEKLADLNNEPPIPPTKIPTKVPTKEPAKVPTKEPAKVPTKEPAKVPTKEPVKVPTKEPVKMPTKEPAKEVKNPLLEELLKIANQADLNLKIKGGLVPYLQQNLHTLQTLMAALQTKIKEVQDSIDKDTEEITSRKVVTLLPLARTLLELTEANRQRAMEILKKDIFENYGAKDQALRKGFFAAYRAVGKQINEIEEVKKLINYFTELKDFINKIDAVAIYEGDLTYAGRSDQLEKFFESQAVSDLGPEAWQKVNDDVGNKTPYERVADFAPGIINQIEREKNKIEKFVDPKSLDQLLNAQIENFNNWYVNNVFQWTHDFITKFSIFSEIKRRFGI